MQSEPSNQHQNMPDPLDFKPGDKTLSNPVSPATSQAKSNFKLRGYMLPMVINLFIFTIVQIALGQSCNDVPEGLKGECGAGWINLFIVIPLEVVVFSICLIIILIGVSRWSKAK